jgi:hypothetical protein
MSFCDSEVSELTYPLLINLFCTFARGHSAYEQSFMIFLSIAERILKTFLHNYLLSFFKNSLPWGQNVLEKWNFLECGKSFLKISYTKYYRVQGIILISSQK